MPGVPEIFFSAILSVNPNQNYILLDEINSPHGHELLLIHKKFNILTKIDGIELQFSGNLINATEKNGIAIYKIEFPESVLYLQKRQSFRINIGLGTSIPIKLKREDGIPVYGRIINLSETGAGIMLDTPCSIQISDIFPHCELRISEELTIKCQLEVCYISTDKTNDPQRVGGQFIGLDGSQQRELRKLVLKLQRDLMKRLPKNTA